MRTSVIIAVVAGLLVAVWVLREAQLRRRIETVAAANQTLAQNLEAASHQIAETQEETLGSRQQPESFQHSIPQSDTPAASGYSNRIVALEKRVQSLTRQLTQRSSGPSVSEYDPTQPPPAAPAAPAPADSPPRRNWGEEQILGPPDTGSAGDMPTAWASREPDAGPEWLAAGFDSAVDIAEVRIRETFNPGAIAKVTAIVGGQEMVLWEGTAAAGGTVPRDFVIRPPFNVSANSIVVHVDSARVKGWNEIDAVELVGRDGSRQWATSASASSTYAPNRTVENDIRLSRP